MRVRATGNLNSRSDQHVILNIDPSDMAVVANIGMSSEAGSGLGDERTKGDLCCRMAVGQCDAIKSATHQRAADAR